MLQKKHSFWKFNEKGKIYCLGELRIKRSTRKKIRSSGMKFWPNIRKIKSNESKVLGEEECKCSCWTNSTVFKYQSTTGVSEIRISTGPAELL